MSKGRHVRAVAVRMTGVDDAMTRWMVPIARLGSVMLSNHVVPRLSMAADTFALRTSSGWRSKSAALWLRENAATPMYATLMIERGLNHDAFGNSVVASAIA